jgi:broad specificity phosphatase PhoE
MHITFLRHAQSIFNAYLTSEKDCDITLKGKEQAAALEGEYDVIVLSCLRRTHQTLTYSNLRAKRILMTDLCREKRVDICDYLEGEDETKKESLEELGWRIESFRNFLRAHCKETDRILVIAHGDFIFHATGRQAYPDNAEMRQWSI